MREVWGGAARHDSAKEGDYGATFVREDSCRGCRERREVVVFVVFCAWRDGADGLEVVGVEDPSVADAGSAVVAREGKVALANALGGGAVAEALV